MSEALRNRVTVYMFTKFPSTALALLLLFVGTLAIRTWLAVVPVITDDYRAEVFRSGGTLVLEYVQEGRVGDSFWGKLHRHVICDGTVYDLADVSTGFAAGTFVTRRTVILPGNIPAGAACVLQSQISYNPSFAIGTAYADLPEVAFTVGK